MVERFFRTLKYESVYLKNYKTLREARAGIGEYIEFYNKSRLHSLLEYCTPEKEYSKSLRKIV
nr:integrase core domain-containing protein [Deferribacter autotrophicus]